MTSQEYTVPSESSMRDTMVNCLSQQINEFELLKSMYPQHGEILVSDSSIIDEINHFINDNNSAYMPRHLDFSINLQIEGLHVELCVNLPTLYPTRALGHAADVRVRSERLSREQQAQLSIGLQALLAHLDTGTGDNTVYLHNVLEWLHRYVNMHLTEPPQPFNHIPLAGNKCNEDKFVRLWIYSHHIYNKKKRDDIVRTAKQLHLTGFCVPGKPGVVCVEGPDSDCNTWWQHIRAMSWKKIVIRKTEMFSPTDRAERQKFNTFEEIHFSNPVARHSKHADMSSFSKYMEQHGLSQTFNDLFGLCTDA